MSAIRWGLGSRVRKPRMPFHAGKGPIASRTLSSIPEVMNWTISLPESLKIPSAPYRAPTRRVPTSMICWSITREESPRGEAAGGGAS